jgi:hypothetical protein
MFNILGYKGNVNQNTARFHLFLVKAIIKKTTTNTGEDAEKK